MKDFNRGGRSNDRRGGGNFGRRDSGGRDSGGRGFNRGGDNFSRPAMHKAVCSECHADCEIPFRPTGTRPIFCSACFEKQGGGAPRQNKFGGGRDERPRFEDRNFAKGGNVGQPNQESKDILKGIKTLNYKIDQLIKILAPEILTEKIEETNSAPKKAGKEKIQAKAAKEKVVKKKVVKKKK